MSDILYIGEDQDSIDRFVEQGVSFHQVKNVVGFHNKIETVDEYDLILSEYNLKGLKADKIFERYKGLLNKKRIPFSIIDTSLDLGKRKELLNLGIMELYPMETSPKVIESRGYFFKANA